MGRYRIDTPDGQSFEIEGPDGATDEQLDALVRQQIGDKFKNSPIKQNAPTYEQQDPETALIEDVGQGVAELGRGFAQGAGDVLDHAADWAQSGLNAAGNFVGAGNLGDTINSAWGSGQNDLAGAFGEARPGYEGLNGIGQFAGNVAATLPLAAVPGGAFTQGAAGGALLSDSDNVVGVAGDALIGGVGGKVGERVIRGAANLAAPQLDDGLQTLVREGVSVTPGQAARTRPGFANKVVAAAEDRASGLPFVGDAITRDRGRSIRTFDTAAINRSLSPIGQSLPEGTTSGRRAIKYAGDKLSEAYNDVLPQLSATGDSGFIDDLSRIHSEVGDIARYGQFERTLRQLGDRYFGNGTSLNGDAFKAIETRLGEKARRYARSPDADQQELGDAFEQVLGAVREMAARQNPAVADRLRAINKGWASLTQVERAGLTTSGEFGPAGYSQAVRNSSATARRRGYSRGEALNQDLSDAASDILPSDIPDSGTAGRWAQSNLLGLAAGAAGMVPYAVSKGVNAATLRNSYINPQLADLLRQGSRYAGIAAPAAISSISNGAP